MSTHLSSMQASDLYSVTSQQTLSRVLRYLTERDRRDLGSSSLTLSSLGGRETKFILIGGNASCSQSTKIFKKI